MPDLQRETASIHYETWGEGSGPWITLINGHTRSLTDFRAMGRFLVDRGWRVLAFDNRGAGLTRSPGAFSVDDIARDIVALWDKEGCARSHVLGISFGGAIAMTLARTEASRIGSLVLVSTAMHFEHVQGTEGSETKPELANYFSPRFPSQNPLLFRAMLKETEKACGDPARATGSSAQHVALRDFDAGKWLSSIRLPTLVVHGEEDGIVPVAAAKKIAAVIPGAKLFLFPAAGHLLLAEVPKKLYEVVVDFCDEAEAKSAATV